MLIIIRSVNQLINQYTTDYDTIVLQKYLLSVSCKTCFDLKFEEALGKTCNWKRKQNKISLNFVNIIFCHCINLKNGMKIVKAIIMFIYFMFVLVV